MQSCAAFAVDLKAITNYFADVFEALSEKIAFWNSLTRALVSVSYT